MKADPHRPPPSGNCALLVAMLALLLGFGAAGARADATAPAHWREVTEPPLFQFPGDSGSHPDYRTEWWYITGILRDAGAREFGYQITFFRRGLDAAAAADAAGTATSDTLPLRATAAIAAHFAIADIGAERFVHADRIRRATGHLAGASPDQLDVFLDTWYLRAAPTRDGHLAIFAEDPVSGAKLDLSLASRRPRVLHGDRGYSRKGDAPGNASAYYSWTRLETSGTLELAGRRVEVRGMSWYDHEFGTSQLAAGVIGWDWFGLRLADGSDLMVYRLRTKEGGASRWSSGTVLRPDGATIHLASEDFSLTPRRTWMSPATGAAYPVEWRLRVPRLGMEIDIAARIDNAELDSRKSTSVIYWEGPVRLAGSHSGEGYMELTGYADSLEGRF